MRAQRGRQSTPPELEKGPIQAVQKRGSVQASQMGCGLKDFSPEPR